MIEEIRETHEILESLDEVMMSLMCFLVINRYNVRFGIPKDKSKPIMELEIDIHFDATRGKELLRQVIKAEEKQNHTSNVQTLEKLYQRLSRMEEKTNKMHNKRLTAISE